MKKRILALTLGMIVLACCVLSGCEKQPGAQEDGTLSVYVVESDALYVNAVGDFQKQAGDGALKGCLMQNIPVPPSASPW